jgi:ubiquinone biosynthesis protein COQ4
MAKAYRGIAALAKRKEAGMLPGHDREAEMDTATLKRKPRTTPPMPRDFVPEMLKTLDDPQAHGVHILFNQYWAHAPDSVRAAYVDGGRDDPAIAAWLDQRWFCEPFDFGALADLPAGSFGRAYYDHIVANNLDRKLASGYRKFHEMLEASGVLKDMPGDVKYKTLRGFQIHDLLHIVTGYDTTPLGEIALQAFGLAQMPNLYNGMWVATVTTRMTYLDPMSQAPLMDAISAGWQFGRACPNLNLVRWEEMLSRDLKELRAAYGIAPEGRRMAV